MTRIVSRAARAVPALLFVIVSSRVLPAPGEESGQPCFRSADFRGPESCAPCHPQHYQEWRGSAHAYATVDPIFIACNRKAQEETGGKLGAFCIGCHAPLGKRTGELDADFTSQDLRARPAVLSHGVSCEVCHRMEPPAEGEPIGNASFRMSDGSAFYGRLRNPAATLAHDSRASDFLGESRFCGSCHDVLRGAEAVEKSFAEWSASPYRSDRHNQCQDCHMLRYSGQAAVNGPFRETLRRHNFPAVSVPLIDFPNHGRQSLEVQAFLRTAARMAVHLPDQVQAGGELAVEVRVKNSGAGHNLPTGISTFRQMWLEVTARDADGGFLYRSGHLDANGDLMDDRSALAPEGDPALVSFSDRFLDAEGREVLFLWQAARVKERSLGPLEERTATYRIPVPAALAGSRLRLDVRLLFRSFAPWGLRAFGVGELAARVPVWEMDSFRAPPVAVVRELPRRTEYRVPEDFAGPQAAIDALQDGDRVLVGPGEHVLLAPLDFRGKQIALVSRAGPEETTLRLDAGAPAEAASVVIFRGGEGRGARLTGFTISGGRGTQRLARRDGGDPGGAGRRGGGILIESSSPTIAGNVITGNGATQGLGGGIHVEGGSPAITGNVVSGNWAGSGGGLAASGHARDGDAGPWMFDGNSFSGNVAERGGAVYIEGPARVELTHTLLAGNFASERGGAIHIDSGASLRIDRTTMVFNKALGSSGVLRADTGGVAAITSSVLWGNAPARVEAPISYSLLERAPDGSAAEGSLASGNRAAFPLFVDPAGEWQVAPAPPEFSGKSWPGRWVGGDYHLLPGSPAIDVGDPHAAADPDDTPADAGAFYLEQPLRAFVRGDVGGDGAATWADVALLARHLVAREPLRCLDAADLDDSGSVGPIDAVRLGLYLLTGRLAPAPPFPDCGLDPTFGEGLSCVRKADPCRPEGSP